MATYKIKNWHKFQHFKDRRPPWIKLHREILDQRDIMAISGDAFRFLVCLWLIASEDDEKQGSLPSVEDIAFRLRLTVSKTSDLLKQVDIFLISEGYHVDAPETETETETETDKTWRNDYQTYLSEEMESYTALKSDIEWLRERQKFNPSLNIRLSLEKAHVEYWATETGWEQKKKSRKTKTIDWKSTYNKAFSINKVYLEKGEKGISLVEPTKPYIPYTNETFGSALK